MFLMESLGEVLRYSICTFRVFIHAMPCVCMCTNMCVCVCVCVHNINVSHSIAYYLSPEVSRCYTVTVVDRCPIK